LKAGETPRMDAESDDPLEVADRWDRRVGRARLPAELHGEREQGPQTLGSIFSPSVGNVRAVGRMAPRAVRNVGFKRLCSADLEHLTTASRVREFDLSRRAFQPSPGAVFIDQHGLFVRPRFVAWLAFAFLTMKHKAP